MSLYVITASVAGFDNLRRPDCCDSAGARWLCFTDNPLQPRCDPWEFRPLPALADASRTSRLPKILPHLFFPDDCDVSIWHDANLQLKMPPQLIAEAVLHSSDWAAHRHPCRTCVYQEADILLREKIGTAALVEADTAHFRKQGHPPGFGLWANGFIARRHTPEVKALCERWWTIYQAGCERDQISFPPALRESELPINTLDYDIYHSPFVNFHFHAPWLERSENPSYWPARIRTAEKLGRLQELTGIESGYKAHVPEGK